MMPIKLITCFMVFCQLSLAADDPLLKYIERYPYYTSDTPIPKELIDMVLLTCAGATNTTYRQASLIRFHYDQPVSIRRRPKEGPDYFEPGIGPQADGFLFTIRLFPNTPSLVDGTRHTKPRIDKISVDNELKVKRAGCLMPIKDGSMFYSISIESGMEVSDQMLAKMMATVTAFAAK